MEDTLYAYAASYSPFSTRHTHIHTLSLFLCSPNSAVSPRKFSRRVEMLRIEEGERAKNLKHIRHNVRPSDFRSVDFTKRPTRQTHKILLRLPRCLSSRDKNLVHTLCQGIVIFWGVTSNAKFSFDLSCTTTVIRHGIGMAVSQTASSVCTMRPREALRGCCYSRRISS